MQAEMHYIHSKVLEDESDTLDIFPIEENHARQNPQPSIKRLPKPVNPLPKTVINHFVEKYQELLAKYADTSHKNDTLHVVTELPKEESARGNQADQTVSKPAKRPAVSRPRPKSNYNGTVKLPPRKPMEWQKYYKPTTLSKHSLKINQTSPKRKVNTRNATNMSLTGIIGLMTTGKKTLPIQQKSFCASRPMRHPSKSDAERDQIPVLSCIKENQQKQQLNGTVHYIIDHCEEFVDNFSTKQRKDMSIKASLIHKDHNSVNQPEANPRNGAENKRAYSKGRGHRRTESIRFDQTMLSGLKKTKPTVKSEVAGLLKPVRKVFVLAGWGLSAPSGVPSLTPNKDLWEQDPSAILSSVMLNKRPGKLWDFLSKYRKLLANKKPNPAHLALKDLCIKLHKESKNCYIVTHAIDGLLASVWNSSLPRKVLSEMCGNINYMRCKAGCEKRIWSVPEIVDKPPVCENCKGSMRPHVLLRDEKDLGEYFDFEEVLEKGLECDCMIIVGSKLNNIMLRGLVDDHLISKKLTININTENSGNWIKKNIVSITDPCEVSLPQIVNNLSKI